MKKIFAVIVAVVLCLGVFTGPSFADGNNGTLKVHEYGTSSGTESNDPKVCKFNFEGFGFDADQSLHIVTDPAGVDVTITAGDDGFFATEYFEIASGKYKATAYGKDTKGEYTEEKAKSKVFKVECETVVTTPTPTPTETPTTPVVTEPPVTLPPPTQDKPAEIVAAGPRTLIDECGVENDFVVFYDAETEVYYTVVTKGLDKIVTAHLRLKYEDTTVLVGTTTWTLHFTDEKCPVDKPTHKPSVEPPVTHKPTPTHTPVAVPTAVAAGVGSLPNTGGPLQALIFLGALLALAGGGFIVYGLITYSRLDKGAHE